MSGADTRGPIRPRDANCSRYGRGLTGIASFLFKRDTRSELYLPYLENRELLISFMTEAELEPWALAANWSGKRTEWLRLFLAKFAIVPSSHGLVLKCAEAMATARKAGRRIDTADAWIAATALLYNAPLLTSNKSDYLGVTSLRFADSP
jgi:predicted nucleic acid-binding protein